MIQALSGLISDFRCELSDIWMDIIRSPKYKYLLYSDMEWITGSAPFASTTTGSSTTNTNYAVGDSGRVGIKILDMPQLPKPACSILLAPATNMINVGEGSWIFETDIQFQPTDDADFIFNTGFLNGVPTAMDGDGITNGVYFTFGFGRANHTDYRVYAKVFANSVESAKIDTGIDIETDVWYRLRIEIINQKSYFYIDGNLVGSVDSGLPVGATENTSVGYSCFKKTGDGSVIIPSKRFNIDWIFVLGY